MTKVVDIVTKDQLKRLREAGFVVIHREPINAMAKAFYAGKWPEQVDFTEGFHRMVAASINEQNRKPS